MLIIKGSTGSTKGCGYKTKSSLAQQSLVVVLRSIGVRLTQTFQAEVMAETLKFGLLYRTPTRGKLDPAGARTGHGVVTRHKYVHHQYAGRFTTSGRPPNTSLV